MHHQKTALAFLFTGLALVIITGVLLANATPARAQCGSQASSCKNCHEVQGEHPVNADGTSWHQSHAFGDFCYICHGGNQQATDKAAAHEGMVDPLSDVKASCQQCHAADLDARAKVYADALGVELGSTASAPPAAGESAGGDSAAAPVAAAPAASSGGNCNESVVDDPNAVDYVAKYNEVVLGQKPINWGNMILIGLIALVAVGGGGYVITREKLVNVKLGDTKAVDAEYPADVVDMLPQLSTLKASARKSLKNVLETKKAEKILDLMDEIIREDEE